MTEAIECVKGFKDFLGEDSRKREIIRNILVKNFQLYGFEPAETPIVENVDFVKGENQNDEAVSDIFRLWDRGERALALRYEFTFQLKRIAQNQKLPFKRYQIGEVFRDEPTSSNRFRQFTQCDADIISSSAKDEAEILAMASRILDELGIRFEINLNNRKLLNEILDKEDVKQKAEVIRELDKLDKLTESEVKANLKKYKAEKLIEIFNNTEKYFEKYENYKEIEELRRLCSMYNVKFNFQPTLARGLSYYNGTIFEIKTGEMKETIIGGGAFLVNNIQSAGISFGLNRLDQLAKIKTSEKRVLIISIGMLQEESSIKLVEKMRNEGIGCSIMFGKISKALEFANSYSLPYVIFFGEEEAKLKKFKLRDMKSGKEEMISEKELIKRLKAC